MYLREIALSKVIAAFTAFYIWAYADAAGASSSGGASDLVSVIWGIVGSIVAALFPLSFVLGAFMIGFGIKRFVDGNSAPHGGKGALTKIFVGSLLMELKFACSLLLNTLERAGADVIALKQALFIN